MKAGHQFTLDGRWSTAWRFVGSTDPYAQKRTAATDLELEAALREMKVEEDLRRQCSSVGQALVDHHHDGQEESGHRRPNAKATAKTA